MWKKYRTVVEILQAIILTGLPFLTINGESAFRFDIEKLKLYFFGSAIWIREFYLILAATLFFLLLIIFVTVIFGRIWCGWLCPQTVLLDLSETIARLFGRKNARTIRNLLLVPFSGLVSFTIICYFVPPAETIKTLFVSTTVTAFFIVLTVLIYLELTVLGRKFCVSICPYAMLQNALFDKDTLVIEYDSLRDNTCMKCDACVRACPVNIDIKQGLSPRCIACAECIDACRIMCEPRNIPPFPNYRGSIIRLKTLWLGGATAVAALTLLLMIWSRPPVDFIVTRDAEALVKNLNRYSYSIYNNSGEAVILELSSPDHVILIGEHSLILKPFSSLHGKILVKSTDRRDRVMLRLSGNNISINKEIGFL
ncbi:MAG: 4Fe-4S binding protein [Chlorobiales bacterium]|nr:4Fe-4S binding protein [Chlorobiales bacterium]